MLRKLLIRNFAIIDDLEIEFSEKLNIITGETGAGKSIILGALGLLKGDRVSSNQFRDESAKSVIEGYFAIPKKLNTLFKSLDIDFEEETIIRREISPEGKSRAYINDSPCTLTVLQAIGDSLVEIHSQHDSLEIRSNEYQMEIIDAFSDNESLLSELREHYNQLQNLQKEFQALLDAEAKSQSEKELQQYHLQELNQFDFHSWNLEKLEEELQLAENALEIKQQLQLSVTALAHSEVNHIDGLRDILIRLRKMDKFSSVLGNLNEKLDGIIEEVKSLTTDYEHLADNLELDEEKLDQLRSEYDFIHKMLKKHSLSSLEELSELKDQLAKSLSWVENISASKQKLEQLIADQTMRCRELCLHISQNRIRTAPILEKKLLTNLKDLELGNSQFKIDIQTDHSDISSHGFDKIQFLFSANAGSSPRELKNAISGGEMSRFMLAIKSILAEKISLPTLIFDEIDTGVSGLVANRVAGMLEKLAQKHQMIAITHLPQIASKGYHHLNVFKVTEAGKTNTKIKLLHQADREIEIAKMISGEQITPASLTSARELLG